MDSDKEIPAVNSQQDKVNVSEAAESEQADVHLKTDTQNMQRAILNIPTSSIGAKIVSGSRDVISISNESMDSSCPLKESSQSTGVVNDTQSSVFLTDSGGKFSKTDGIANTSVYPVRILANESNPVMNLVSIIDNPADQDSNTPSEKATINPNVISHSALQNSETYSKPHSGMTSVQIPSGTDILAMACEAVSKDWAAKTSTVSRKESRSSGAISERSPKAIDNAEEESYEPNVLQELDDNDGHGKSPENTPETETERILKKVVIRSSSRSSGDKTRKLPINDNSQDADLFSPAVKKRKLKSSTCEHNYSSSEDNVADQSNTTSESPEQEQKEGSGMMNIPVGIVSSPQAIPNGQQVLDTPPDELYTVELTIFSTTGGVIKPMTVTVLNVAGMTFKCGKCRAPFEKQLSARVLSYYKQHNCGNETSATDSKSEVEVAIKLPASAPVTRSAKKSAPSTVQKRPVGRPPKRTQATRGRKPQVNTTPEKSVEETEKEPEIQGISENPGNNSETQESTKETEEALLEVKDEDNGESASSETLSSRNDQLKFISEEYQKARRRSSRTRKSVLAKDMVNSLKGAVAADDGGGDENEEEAEEFQDSGAVEDPADPDFVKEKSDGKDLSDTTDMVPPGAVVVDPKDFCIKCYLKLDHKCRIKERVSNRGKSKTCSICNRTYKTVNSLNQHMRAHTGERPFQCQVCQKAFRRSSTLFEHMKIHNGEKTFLCSVCGRKFLRKSDHTAHVRIHNNDFNFRCTVCNKGFKGNTQLDVHMRKHTGEMPYLCTVCGRKFKHPFGLQVHMKYHEIMENPLRCTECNTIFEDPDELRMHKCSVGEKQHLCSVCGKMFANPFAIKSHMKIHTRPNPSVCKSCQTTFPNELELQVHQDANIVKCSDCNKTIKEARACMLNRLPGSDLKGKKFKCWQCHSSQAKAKASETKVIEVTAQHDAATQANDEIEEGQIVTMTYVEMEGNGQIQGQEVIQVQHPQQVEQTIIQSDSTDISQSMQGYQNATMPLNQSMHSTQTSQEILSQLRQPESIQIYEGDQGSELSSTNQLVQAIQVIEGNQVDPAYYQTQQTVYSSILPPVQAQETVHYTTQIPHQQQQHQTVHQIQQYQNPTTQQQHQQELQTVYQMQPMPQQTSLLNNQRLHQM